MSETDAKCKTKIYVLVFTLILPYFITEAFHNIPSQAFYTYPRKHQCNSVIEEDFILYRSLRKTLRIATCREVVCTILPHV